MKRRSFLQGATALGAGMMAAPYVSKGKYLSNFLPNQAFGFDDNDNILIMIELFGGNDGLNTIIPISNRYYDLRPTVGIPELLAKQWGSTGLYMHPSLVDAESVPNNGFMGLLDQGRLAIIEGVGYQNPNLSHFRSSDIWHSGIISSDPEVRLLEGWLGRFLANRLPNYPFEIPEHPIAISLEGQIPLALKSDKGHMAIAVNDPEDFYDLGRGLTPVENLMQGGNSYQDEFNFIHVIAQQSEQYSTAVWDAYQNGTNEVNYQGGSISQKLKMIARLISGGLKSKVYYIGLSNFDSHVQQRDDDVYAGQHPEHLENIAAGVTTFIEDMVIQGQSERILGYTFSEFGRRAFDNGSRGTDHGAGSMMFMFGHNEFITGGRHGFKPDLEDLDNGNLRSRPEEDFRRVYADILKYWFQADEQEITTIFGEIVDPLEIVSPRVGVENEYLKGAKDYGLTVLPNPTNGEGFLKFELIQRADVNLMIYSLDGRRNLMLKQGVMNPGIYKIPFLLTQTGSYTAVAVINGRRYATQVQVVK